MECLRWEISRPVVSAGHPRHNPVRLFIPTEEAGMSYDEILHRFLKLVEEEGIGYHEYCLVLAKELKDLRLQCPEDSEELVQEYVSYSRRLARDSARLVGRGVPLHLGEIRDAIFRLENQGLSEHEIASCLHTDDIKLIKEVIPHTESDHEFWRIARRHNLQESRDG